MLLYIAIISYASLFVAAFPHQDRSIQKAAIACLIIGCLSAVGMFLTAVGVCDLC